MNFTNSLASRPECEECGLYRKCMTPKIRTKQGRSGVFVVGQSPNNHEDVAGRVTTNATFLKILNHLGVDAWMQNAVRCNVPGGKKPLKLHVDHCNQLLQQDILDSGCRRILLCGELATRAVLGEKKGKFSRICGVPHYKNGNVYLPTHSIACLDAGQDSFYISQVMCDVAFIKNCKLQPRDYAPKVYIAKTEVEQLALIESLFRAENPVAWDVETTGLEDPYLGNNRLETLGFAWEDGVCWAMPFDHPEVETPSHRVVAALRSWFASDVPKFGHFVKFDCRVVEAWLGITVNNIIDDTMLMANQLDENDRKGLKYLATRYLKIAPWGDVTDQETLDDLLTYNAMDAWATRGLWRFFKPHMKPFYYEHIMPVYQAIRELEGTGLYVDKSHLEGAIQHTNIRMNMIYSEIQRHVEVRKRGTELNPNSAPQVTKFFGISSSNKATLSKMSHPVAKLILDYRKQRKILSTYLTPLTTMCDQYGIVRPTFNATGTRTGRTSSKQPNAQNQDPSITHVFRSRYGGWIISTDFKQLELRLFGLYSGDPFILDAIARGIDLHTATAMAIFDRETPEEVTKDERKTGKTVNFAVGYGMGIRSLATQLGVDEESAKSFMAEFNRKFSTFVKWRRNTAKKAFQFRHVTALNGRIRHLYISDLAKQDRYLKSLVERQAMNSPVQGLAGDITLRAMVEIMNQFKEKKLKSKVINIIHDEILVDCPEDELDLTSELIRDTMSNMQKHLPWLTVKLDCDQSVARHWTKG